jgi:hypothetical protein
MNTNYVYIKRARAFSKENFVLCTYHVAYMLIIVFSILIQTEINFHNFMSHFRLVLISPAAFFLHTL